MLSEWFEPKPFRLKEENKSPDFTHFPSACFGFTLKLKDPKGLQIVLSQNLPTTKQYFFFLNDASLFTGKFLLMEDSFQDDQKFTYLKNSILRKIQKDLFQSNPETQTLKKIERLTDRDEYWLKSTPIEKDLEHGTLREVAKYRFLRLFVINHPLMKLFVDICSFESQTYAVASIHSKGDLDLGLGAEVMKPVRTKVMQYFQHHPDQARDEILKQTNLNTETFYESQPEVTEKKLEVELSN